MSDNDRVVEGEVVGGAPTLPPPASASRPSFFHPLSGLVILGVDWLAFGMDLVTGFAGLALTAILAFAVTFYAVLMIQRRFRADPPGPAMLKALLGGLVAGLPFPVAGTLVGAAIVALSGLPDWRRLKR